MVCFVSIHWHNNPFITSLDAWFHVNAGVAAGSIAASLQGVAVASGSWFAYFQSLGTTTLMGTPVGLGLGAAQAIGGAAYSIYINYFKEEEQRTDCISEYFLRS